VGCDSTHEAALLCGHARFERAAADFHLLAPVISLLGADLVYEGGQQRVSGLTCKKCGASQARDTGNAAITVTSGSYPHRPCAFGCALCGESYGTIAGMVEAFGPEDWRGQLELLRKVGGSTPQEREWVIAEDGGHRAMRPTARAAIDAIVTPTTGSTIRLCKVIAYTEAQVTQLLHDSALPMRETTIDRFGRPLEQWNVRPTVGERNELADAQRDHRRAVEATIDQELRTLRNQKLAEAGI